ncbi:uncharacterized protein LOC142977278 [Anticarsia gemmatalis]|uniref:uncharacterized protein LOC142977278 n=1 Tax=Anticarsia gemmatalis TaxID=129554 RepID=UPI003F771348
MFGLNFLFWTAVLTYFGRVNVYAAMSQDEKDSLKDEVHPFVLECIEELGLSKEELLAMIDKDGSEADLDPCFLSCFLKKTEMMDSKGMFDSEKVLELTEPHIEKPEDLEKLNKLRHECERVNEAEVSDGEKGCERAKLLMECFMEFNNDVL